MMKKLIFLLLLLPSAQGQDEPTFKSESRLVEVYATVFDHGNRAVQGLTKEQFEIRDDGAARTIRHFETSEKALSCALLLDTTASMTAALPALRNSARLFIDALRPGDAVGIYSFNESVEELSEVTSDRVAARRALMRLRAGGRTALFDAITHVALQIEKRPGKKVIVVLTDGGDNASILNRQSAALRARKAGVPIFAVAEGDALADATASNMLRDLSDSTGGHMYKAKQSKDMEAIFADIARDLENGYLLAFEPPSDGKLLKWHELEIVVKDAPKLFKVRARTGYSTDGL